LAQGGMRAEVRVRSARAAALAELMPKTSAAGASKLLLCPMPGLVVSVNVVAGQDVKAGETLAVVEAMKMENVLTAEHDATVKKVNARKGDSLALDDVIMEFA
jgi:propionyl-CoA carboxylase alpha chain